MRIGAFFLALGLFSFWAERESNRSECSTIEDLNRRFKVYIEFDPPPVGDETAPRGEIAGGEHYASTMVSVEDSAFWRPLRCALVVLALLIGAFLFARGSSENIEELLFRLRGRMDWHLVLATVAVSAAIITGLYFGQRVVQGWAVEVVSDAYDPLKNPDLGDEANWVAMSWEQKRASKQKFAEGLVRRKFRSEQLQTVAVFMQVGIVVTGLLGVAVVVADVIQRNRDASETALHA